MFPIFFSPDTSSQGIPAHLEAEASGPAAPGPAQPAQAASTPATVPAQASVPEGQPQNLFQVCILSSYHLYVSQTTVQLAQQQQQSGGGAGAGNAPIPNAGGPRLDLEALRNHPQIALLREQLASNPENVQPLIQQLARENPQMAQAIARSPEVLMQLLGIPLDEDDEGGQHPPGVQTISVTPEEREAIGRVSGDIASHDLC